MRKRRLDLCDRVGFSIEPFQAKIAGALLGPEREKLITLPRKNGKSRVVGTFAAHSDRLRRRRGAAWPPFPSAGTML